MDRFGEFGLGVNNWGILVAAQLTSLGCKLCGRVSFTLPPESPAFTVLHYCHNHELPRLLPRLQLRYPCNLELSDISWRFSLSVLRQLYRYQRLFSASW